MLVIILGVFTILLGAKAFTPKGLPLTNKKNLTGTPAKVIGIVCITLGAAFIVWGLLSVLSVTATLTNG
ncbi:MAG: hypothetical protein MPJ50_10670 [Pirellulales bacterium]|nr:hypothetical protein [Pirellulales bacterium]